MAIQTSLVPYQVPLLLQRVPEGCCNLTWSLCICKITSFAFLKLPVGVPVYPLKIIIFTLYRNSCCCWVTKSRPTLCNPMDGSTPISSVLHYFLEFAQIRVESVMTSNHLTLFCPLLLLPSVFPRISVFSNKSPLYIRWPKCWSFSVFPMNNRNSTCSQLVHLLQ